jgi:hypothetical protein
MGCATRKTAKSAGPAPSKPCLSSTFRINSCDPLKARTDGDTESHDASSRTRNPPGLIRGNHVEMSNSTLARSWVAVDVNQTKLTWRKP